MLYKVIGFILLTAYLLDLIPEPNETHVLIVLSAIFIINSVEVATERIMESLDKIESGVNSREKEGAYLQASISDYEDTADYYTDRVSKS